MEDVQRIGKSTNYGILYFLDELTLNASLSGFIEGTSGFIEGESEREFYLPDQIICQTSLKV